MLESFENEKLLDFDWSDCIDENKVSFEKWFDQYQIDQKFKAYEETEKRRKEYAYAEAKAIAKEKKMIDQNEPRLLIHFEGVPIKSFEEAFEILKKLKEEKDPNKTEAEILFKYMMRIL